MRPGPQFPLQEKGQFQFWVSAHSKRAGRTLTSLPEGHFWAGGWQIGNAAYSRRGRICQPHYPTKPLKGNP